MDTITNSNYKELLIDKGSLIKYHQNITFTYEDIDYLYYTMDDFLVCVNEPLNSAIFTALGLDKMKFCEKHYGYKPMYGDFPIFIDKDYDALTRLVIALFEEIESLTGSPKEEISAEKIKPETVKLNVSLIDSKVTIRI